MYKTLLVPLDGSGNANKALDVAAQLARPGEGELYLLHIPEPGSASGTPAGTGPTHASGCTAEKSGRTIIDNALDVVDPRDVRHHVLVIDGTPGEIIEREAIRLDADAIVMGHRGLTRGTGESGGHVSREILARAACRVITVR
ncbi:nucleotide-binding universal stress UspA family protein [Kushneria sinocarnis]|uniref:Nucleotide-binding universal stress UspA family protein n=1 Tax=Kushneria sinocarnis TaxID=595502 RepID=A0A420WZU3_9GAMM|nr:universal stress protein [Kushneria sinocarnis]RKR06888.1 nucleotide-binding universal stress UspA family protein [Kushneria sinocarnis]